MNRVHVERRMTDEVVAYGQPLFFKWGDGSSFVWDPVFYHLPMGAYSLHKPCLHLLKEKFPAASWTSSFDFETDFWQADDIVY